MNFRTTSMAFALVQCLALDPLVACRPGDANDFCAHLDSAGVLGSPEEDGQFGAALAFGDFNGDGLYDLAVGAPGQASGEGEVFVFYAVGRALVADGMQRLFNQFGGPADAPGFGFALAAADLNQDGIDDLAVGAPFQDLPNTFANCVGAFCTDSGVVHLFEGTTSGLDAIAPTFFEPADVTFDMHYGFALAAGKIVASGADILAIGIPGSPGDGLIGRPGRVEVRQSDGFSTPAVVAELQVEYPTDEAGGDEQGAALAIGRFASQPKRQIVFAAAESNVGGNNGAGRIEVATYDGSAYESRARFVQSDFGNSGDGSGSRFGAALATGDFNRDTRLDLAIGAPDRDLAGGFNRAGRVYVAFGLGTGLSTDPFRILQNDSFPNQTLADLERFGAALAGGDFDGDTFDDLAIGAPGEGSTDVGFVYLAWGSAAGLNPDATKGTILSQAVLGGSNSADDQFGSALAARDLDGNVAGVEPDELAFGVPLKNVAGTADAGMVFVTRILDPVWIFGDGFESAGPAVWSATAP